MTNSPKIIAIAEDEVLYGKILKNKLEKEGYRVTHCLNGEALLQAIRAQKPDLILLDLIMPIKDGFQTLKEIKSDPTLQNIKVIVLSNLGQEEDIKTVMNLGATNYLVKADTQFTNAIAMIKNNLED